jgi:hypothetical protein
LGEFGPDAKRYVAAVEGKGPKDPLDRPFAGRKVSALDQAFDYAINRPLYQAPPRGYRDRRVNAAKH